MIVWFIRGHYQRCDIQLVKVILIYMNCKMDIKSGGLESNETDKICEMNGCCPASPTGDAALAK